MRPALHLQPAEGGVEAGGRPREEPRQEPVDLAAERGQETLAGREPVAGERLVQALRGGRLGVERGRGGAGSFRGEARGGEAVGQADGVGGVQPLVEPVELVAEDLRLRPRLLQRAAGPGGVGIRRRHVGLGQGGERPLRRVRRGRRFPGRRGNRRLVAVLVPVGRQPRAAAARSASARFAACSARARACRASAAARSAAARVAAAASTRFRAACTAARAASTAASAPSASRGSGAVSPPRASSRSASRAARRASSPAASARATSTPSGAWSASVSRRCFRCASRSRASAASVAASSAEATPA